MLTTLHTFHKKIVYAIDSTQICIEQFTVQLIAHKIAK